MSYLTAKDKQRKWLYNGNVEVDTVSPFRSGMDEIRKRGFRYIYLFPIVAITRRKAFAFKSKSKSILCRGPNFVSQFQAVSEVFSTSSESSRFQLLHMNA